MVAVIKFDQDFIATKHNFAAFRYQSLGSLHSLLKSATLLFFVLLVLGVFLGGGEEVFGKENEVFSAVLKPFFGEEGSWGWGES